MHAINLLIYNFAIFFYRLGIFFAYPFSKKARLFLNGRKYWKCGLKEIKLKQGKRIWFHCASLGEFEQARPVIEKLKSENRSTEIIITFFSPSGYEIRKNYEHADLVLYLPLDTKANAEEFIRGINPDVVLFVKYEFWFHYLNELKKKNIPVILFSSVFRKNQIFFKWYGSLFRSMLKMFSKIFVQNDESKELLKNVSIESEVAFDTRFDRVYQIAQTRNPFSVIEKFKGNSKILIAGSTWKKDEDLILQCIEHDVLKEYKYIIAPHNIGQHRIDEIIKSLSVNAKRFSELNEENSADTDVVIVDSIGQLASLYAYGDIAYIGGGFNASVHNVLEAAVYGIPVLFGPNFKKSLEAKELFYLPVTHFDSLKNALLKLASNNDALIAVGKRNKHFVEERLGGSEQIVRAIQKYL